MKITIVGAGFKPAPTAQARRLCHRKNFLRQQFGIYNSLFKVVFQPVIPVVDLAGLYFPLVPVVAVCLQLSGKSG
jgi:hypothetical protein